MGGSARVTSLEHTLARPFRVHGVGLRKGREAVAELRPASEGTGRVFVIGGVRIPATVAYVTDTRLATTLGLDGARVSMVEHLCAALYGCGIDNVEVHVDGDEVPVLDGSARTWVDAIETAGTAPQTRARSPLTVREEVRVEVNGAWAILTPAPHFELDLTIDFAHPSIRRQRYIGHGEGPAFREHLSWARTFGFLKDAEQLRAAGLARGASLDNTVVYDDAGVLNPGGLRHPEEAVRHKALDAVGDMALLGRPLHARLTACRAGHALHVAVLNAVVAASSRPISASVVAEESEHA